MGFKTDSSFLRFVTMGAAGVRRVMGFLRAEGFSPIELERYSTSNKIWATKLKRLRLPDLLCVRTGLRVEVRAKSVLSIKMSDAPGNADRSWHAGLRDDDLVAFVACRDVDGVPCAAEQVNLFRVDALKASESLSRLGQPKSAGEGSERDREWPSYVPKNDGHVQTIIDDAMAGTDPTHLQLQLLQEGSGPRRYKYPLGNKRPYGRVGERFVGGTTILAGAPAAKADLTAYQSLTYDPLADLESNSAVDRYAAVKAMRHRADSASARNRLEARIREETDTRVQLEAAGSAAALGSAVGEDFLREVVIAGESAPLQMEAIFILTEIATPFSRDMLVQAAENAAATSELRQAAVWGLGFAGHARYDYVLPFLADADENVAMHAIAAFGPGAPVQAVAELVARLDERNPVLAAASAEALRLIGTDAVIISLADAAGDNERRNWALATLGRLDPNRVRVLVDKPDVLQAVTPLIRVFSAENWLATGDRPASLSYLLGQRF